MSNNEVIISLQIHYTSYMKKISVDFVLKAILIALLAFVVFNFSTINSYCGKCIVILQPIFIGVVLALIINVPMVFFYNKAFKKIKKEKIRKGLSLTLAFLFFLSIFAAVIGIAIPAAARSVQSIVNQMSNGDIWESISAGSNFGRIIVNLGDKLYHYIVARLSTYAPKMMSIANSFVRVIINLVLGIALSIMILANGDKLKRQGTKLITFIFKEKTEKMAEVTDIALEKFSRYLGGQVIEAFIFGVACYVSMVLLRLPYAALVALIMGFGNLIPIAGAYIGGGLCTVIIFAISPIKALIFVIFIIILQQVESFTTYPIIVGKYVGLNGFWIMTSIIVWGGLFGFWGLFLGVPMTAFLQDLIRLIMQKKEWQLAPPPHSFDN